MSRWNQVEREHTAGGTNNADGTARARAGRSDAYDDRAVDDRRDPTPTRSTYPSNVLQLPRTDERHPVASRDRAYSLRASEADLLAIVGAFRVVPEEALSNSRDVAHLVSERLVERHEVTVNERATTVCVLTREAKALLEANQAPRSRTRHQRFHAGLVKPRELAHDAQLYRIYQAEAERLARNAGTVTRVVLDYELKREYQTFLNRPDRSPDSAIEDERRAFAQLSQLPIVDGHLELPDLRIEYETPDGVLAYRDVELVTEHYSRGQMVGKVSSGFSLYHIGTGGATGQSGARGTPLDPHYLDWLR